MQLGLLVEQPRILADLPRRRARELGSGGRNIAGTEFPSLVSRTTETDPRFQPGIEVGMTVERQTPVTAVHPLEALGVEGEGAAGDGHEEGASVRVHGVAEGLRVVERQGWRVDGRPPGPRVVSLSYGGGSPRYSVRSSRNRKSLPPTETKRGMTWSARLDGHGQMVMASVQASKARMAGLDSSAFMAKILEPWETKFHDLTCGASMRAIGGSVKCFGERAASASNLWML
jgi:hypothetical protein